MVQDTGYAAIKIPKHYSMNCKGASFPRQLFPCVLPNVGNDFICSSSHAACYGCYAACYGCYVACYGCYAAIVYFALTMGPSCVCVDNSRPGNMITAQCNLSTGFVGS